MYLNFNDDYKCSIFNRLTLTLDVFKSRLSINTCFAGGRLTLTLDVFKSVCY